MDWQNWAWHAWLGDLNQVKSLTPHAVGVLSIAVAALSGAIVGLEREKREKPAGFRTLILICVGSAIFSIVSRLAAGDRFDPGRIAAQVAPGVGFLGAGAIIHERKAVVGLTTAATIWAVAAIGVLVGIGYAAAGIVLAFFIFAILTFLRALERWMFGPCRIVTARLRYRPERGKTRQKIQAILDDNHVPFANYRYLTQGSAAEPSTQETFEVTYCARHRAHRWFLPEVAALAEVEDVDSGY